VLDKIRYLTAIEEENQIIAQADRPLRQGRQVRRGAPFPPEKGGDFLFRHHAPTEYVNIDGCLPQSAGQCGCDTDPFSRNMTMRNRALMGSKHGSGSGASAET